MFTHFGRILFCLVLFTGAARAEISQTDTDQIRSVISGQLSAFQTDDGVKAFSFASPKIRGIFGDSDNFISMVKSGFPAVYRPQSVQFLEIQDTPNGPVQDVYIIGPDGVPAVARYSLQKQPDGVWKISGCQMIERPTVGA